MWKVVVITALALTGCDTTSDAQDAAVACGGIRNPNTRDACISNYVNNARIGRDAEWSAAGAAYLSNRPARTCTNIGGIVTCQ